MKSFSAMRSSSSFRGAVIGLCLSGLLMIVLYLVGSTSPFLAEATSTLFHFLMIPTLLITTFISIIYCGFTGAGVDDVGYGMIPVAMYISPLFWAIVGAVIGRIFYGGQQSFYEGSEDD